MRSEQLRYTPFAAGLGAGKMKLCRRRSGEAGHALIEAADTLFIASNAALDTPNARGSGAMARERFRSHR
jgi:hypothetical protein